MLGAELDKRNFRKKVLGFGLLVPLKERQMAGRHRPAQLFRFDADKYEKLKKRGFMSFAFDGQYKFVRYYAPDNFNTPVTLEQILRDNDLQLFDLRNDPLETHNLALNPEKSKDLILRMNALLNELMANEVGKNDGSFLPKEIRPQRG